MKQQHLHLLITGGTIDSVFDPTQDAIVVNDRSVVTKYFEQAIKAHFKLTSEVAFNLGFAVATNFLSAPGVYLAMNGRVFSPAEVKKNLEKARFE